MSWSRGDSSLAAGRLSRRAVVRSLLLLTIAAPALAACEGSSGFRPMYGSAAVGGGSEKLAQVEFGTIPGRVGQRIRNELLFQSTGGGYPLPPNYRVEVAIREQIVSTLVRKDGEAQSQIYNLEAKFQLIRLADKKVVFEGTSFGRAAFERYNSIFSNVRAREDAENRAARTVALDIRSRLGAFLSGAA
jgi:LPS-assembly lipoprotein